MHTNVVKNEFDLKAGHYESNRLAPWYKAHAQEITKHCPVMSNGDILDIGCATGYQLRLLSESNLNARLVGIDLSPKMTSQAKIRSTDLSGQFHFVTDDWENLSNDSKSDLAGYNFKMIICANTFHYFINPQQAVNQMYEMLDTDGMLLILERDKSSSPLTLLWGLLHRYIIKDQVEFYDAENITRLMTAAGFTSTQMISTIRKYFWKGKLFTSIALIKGKN